MNQRKMFTEKELIKELSSIGRTLKKKLQVYVIGGCSLIFRGRKLSTKDIDVVVLSPADLKIFINTLKSAGYNEIIKMPEEYKKLGASAILRNNNGVQFDVFYKWMCKGLEVTDRMIKRAEFLKKFGNLEIYLITLEDIFLFKGMTERPGDLSDMAVIAGAGINWDVVKEECLLQEKRKIWEVFLVDRLLELEKVHGIHAPILKELKTGAENEMIKEMFISIVKDGKTFKEIADYVKKTLNYSESWPRKELEKLVKKGIIKKEKQGRSYRYRVSKI